MQLEVIDMVRVFLVEDEMLIREGIKNSIRWEKEGYEFVTVEEILLD